MGIFGHYHYIFVHFPIALIVMAAIAELLMFFKKNWNLQSTVDFLLIGAFIFLLPSIGSGLALEETGVAGSSHHDLLEWHEALAYSTLSISILTLLFRFWFGRYLLYFSALCLLVISVILTAHFGGEIAFGPIQYLPGF